MSSFFYQLHFMYLDKKFSVFLQFFNNKLSFFKKLSLFPIFFMTAFFYRKPLIFSKLSDISNFC